MRRTRKDLEQFLEFRQKIQFMTRYAGWKIVHDYIKEKIKEAKNAFWKTKFEGLRDKEIIRKTIGQRAVVMALQDVLDYVHDEEEAVKEAEKDLEAITAIEEEVGED